MDTCEIVAISDTFARLPRCFTQEELLSFIHADKEDQHAILKVIEDDYQFIWTNGETAGDKYFIAKKALYRWYIRLNLRLAVARKARLSDRNLALLISSLRLDGQWNVPPHEFIEYGLSFTLLSPSWNPNEFVFPLAYVISFMPSSGLKVARNILYSLNETQGLESISDQVVLESAEKILSQLSSRESHIIRMREGLPNNPKMTLEQIGEGLELTRERIRQIESKAWTRIRHPRKQSIFREALIYGLMHQNGSLLLRLDCATSLVTAFIVKCNSIPLCIFPYTNIAVIGADKGETLLPSETNLYSPDLNEIASSIVASNEIPIKADDVLTIAKSIQKAPQAPRFTKVQRVYFTLKHINKLAHYSEIAEVYNTLFPEDISTEHSIHAILLREDMGIVWVGIRGTFALAEWGYERPSKTIFDTATEIVEQRYVKTGTPVPFNVIVAEIGKYRKVIQPSSVVFATYCNQKLERVSGDYFIPKTDGEEEKDISKDELDRILEEFERRTKEKMVDPMTMEILLTREKETPGTWRFKENKGDRPMTIYLTKEQVKELGNPETIKLTITAA